jgi:hypothetical protein
MEFFYSPQKNIHRLKIMEKSNGFIRYQQRSKRNKDILYASFCHAKRENGKKINDEIWLGRVIDKEKGIYYTRKDGYYLFSVANGKSNIDNNDLKIIEESYNIEKTNVNVVKRSKYINFGDIYIFNSFLENNNFLNIFKSCCDKDHETLTALILFKLLTNQPYSYAYDWWNETYARYLFPDARLQSQQISEFLQNIGTQESHRRFFLSYIDFVKSLNPRFISAVDSIGLKNDIKTFLTDRNNHDAISNEMRLITILDKISEYPIYCRYVTGNVADISSLIVAMNEMREYDIDINQAILDAGYYSEDNLNEFSKLNVPFMTRMMPRKGLYEQLINEYVPRLKEPENFATFGHRNLFIKKIPVQLFKSKLNLNSYICLDLEKYKSDSDHYFSNFDANIAKDEFDLDLLKFGIFIIVSNYDIDKNDILSCYYDRQYIEQFFYYLKNDIDISPLRDRSETSIAAHILISMMATISFVAIDKELKKIGLSVNSSIESCRRLNCRVYKDKLIPDVAVKKVNDVSKALKIKIPNTLPQGNL